MTLATKFKLPTNSFFVTYLLKEIYISKIFSSLNQTTLCQSTKPFYKCNFKTNVANNDSLIINDMIKNIIIN